MEETILFRRTRDPAVQRAVVAVNNTTGCDVIFKADSSRPNVQLKPSMGVIPVNGRAEVEVVAKSQDVDARIGISYAPSRGTGDVRSEWLCAPPEMTLTKVLRCALDHRGGSGSRGVQDVRVNANRSLRLHQLPNNNNNSLNRLSHVSCMIPKSPREIGGGRPQIVYPGPDQIPTENYCAPPNDSPTTIIQKTLCCAPSDSCFLLICVCVLVGFVVGNLLIEMI